MFVHPLLQLRLTWKVLRLFLGIVSCSYFISYIMTTRLTVAWKSDSNDRLTGEIPSMEGGVGFVKKQHLK